MVMRFLTCFLRASVRDGADAEHRKKRRRMLYLFAKKSLDTRLAQKKYSSLVTCSVHGGACSFEGTQSFATKWNVLLVGWQRLRLKKLPPLLLPKDGVDCFQEVLLTIWRPENVMKNLEINILVTDDVLHTYRQFLKKRIPAAQLESSLWSSFRFRLCMDYFTHCCALRV